MKSLVVKIVGFSCMVFLIALFLIRTYNEKKALTNQIARLESESKRLNQTIDNLYDESPIPKVVSLVAEKPSHYKKAKFECLSDLKQLQSKDKGLIANFINSDYRLQTICKLTDLSYFLIVNEVNKPEIKAFKLSLDKNNVDFLQTDEFPRNAFRTKIVPLGWATGDFGIWSQGDSLIYADYYDNDHKADIYSFNTRGESKLIESCSETLTGGGPFAKWEWDCAKFSRSTGSDFLERD